MGRCIEVGEAGACSGDGLAINDATNGDGNTVYWSECIQKDKWN